MSVGVLGACLVLVFSRTMQRGLDHDEHQFIASATAWSRAGLLPYRDFAHFHMPYLVFLYGVLDDLFGRPFLTARLVSVVAAWGSMLLLHLAVLRSVETTRPWARHALACTAALLLLFNPLFTYTSGIAWNHDIALLLALGSFMLVTRGDGGRQRPFVAGLALGLATGVRLSVAPLGAPLLYQVVRSAPRGERLKPAIGLCTGVALALVPAAVLLLIAPERALFGNLEYPALNTAFRVEQGFARAMDLPGKLRYLLVDVLGEPGNMTLLAFMVFGALCAPLGGTTHGAPRRRLALLFVPFLMIGALAPTPSWHQYFYALVPFAILEGTLGLGAALQRPAVRAAGTVLVAACLVSSALHSLPDYRTLSNLRDPDSWAASRARAVGVRIAAELGAGGSGPPMSSQPRVLTLAPILALEAGLDTDPAFASGPFAWRSARFITADERAEQGLVGADELSAHLAGDPPRAVLTGTEKDGEEPLRAWASVHGYREHDLGDGLILQVSPDAGSPPDSGH